jgi:hypothetical protein
MENINILIFPSGTGVSKEIFDSLKYIRWINIIGIDSDDKNFSYYQFDNLFLGAPFIKDKEETLSYLKNVIKKNNIKCIYPAFDSIIVFLKQHELELGVKIISSPSETCDVCFSKKKTYELLKDHINVPNTYNYEEIKEFPVFLKPECGYGARDSFKINNETELNFYNNAVKNNIISEYLPGEEFTVDCFSSIKHGLIYCEARKRSKTINGLSILTEHVDISELKIVGKKISEKLNFVGSWFFQVKYNNESELTLLEVAPRIPGAACLHRNHGINFPLLSIYEHFGISIDTIQLNNYSISCYKCYENRFKLSLKYNVVYVDFDDTIIIKNKINTKLIQYLYHCKNINKRIILITRNQNVIECLKQFCISNFLFDTIIIVKKEEKKSKYITDNNAIFIDDSYSERFDVFTICKINVFSCDMIECLFDEKL